MRRLEYTVPPDWGGSTVKGFAKGYLGLSVRALAGQKFPGGILVNGEESRVTRTLLAGDRLCLTLPEEPMSCPPEELPLDILYEDEDFLIVNKAPGMPVHPSPGHDRDSLLNAVSFYLLSTGRSYRARPLYRLDKDTSGVLAMAKHRIAAGAVTEKEYLAVCEGELAGAGTVNEPIGLKEGSKIVRACGYGQPAVTHFWALGCAGGHTLVKLRLETGRTHQIRAHMAHMGRPLAGDDLYGGGREYIGRQALHCCSLKLECRAVGMSGTFPVPVPGDILDVFPQFTDKIVKELDLCLRA